MKDPFFERSIVVGGPEDLCAALEQVVCVVDGFADESVILSGLVRITRGHLDPSDHPVQEIMLILAFQPEEEHGGERDTEEEDPNGTVGKSELDSFHERI